MAEQFISSSSQYGLYNDYCRRAVLVLAFMFLISTVGFVINFQPLLFEQSFIFLSGFLSGGLHALSGPDHLSAVLPLIFGRKWWSGLIIGAVWGFGHGAAAGILGLVCCLLRGSFLDQSMLEMYSSILDYAFGITFIVIGAIGLRESVGLIHSENSKSGSEKASGPSFQTVTITALWAIFANGCVLGMSCDSLPSLAPAITISTSHMSIIFLFAYLLGTLVAVAIASAIIAECSSWIGKILRDNYAYNLSTLSSVVAIYSGIALIFQKALSLSNHCTGMLFVAVISMHAIHMYVNLRLCTFHIPAATDKDQGAITCAV